MNSSHPLVEGYRRMLERLQQQLESLGAKEQQAMFQLQHSLDHVVEQAVELDELTREEANIVAGYIKRDLQDAGQHLAESGQELSAWLRFDAQLLEERMLEWFGQAADKTRLELLQWENELDRATHYYSGEVTGPGTLQCEQCSHTVQFHAPGVIPACPQCGGERYTRMNEADN
ncbi:MAG: zinc ribbon-containing protein [Gammaproteobacteria bacterium]